MMESVGLVGLLIRCRGRGRGRGGAGGSGCGVARGAWVEGLRWSAVGASVE